MAPFPEFRLGELKLNGTISMVDLRQRLAGAVIGAFALIGEGAFAEEGRLYPDRIIVEHAEITPASSKADEATGYLTIWNGTGEFVAIDGFESSWIKKITLVDTPRHGAAVQKRPIDQPKQIPPRAELLMTKRGIHLEIDATEQFKAGDTVPVIITLVGREPLIARAVVLPSAADLADHHHGNRDG